MKAIGDDGFLFNCFFIQYFFAQISLYVILVRLGMT
ncbi:Uncharacterised protein [Vibrio furnissii]|nr:Uncharacterised protein [Vibrio furnissii]